MISLPEGAEGQPKDPMAKARAAKAAKAAAATAPAPKSLKRRVIFIKGHKVPKDKPARHTSVTIRA